MTVKKRKPKGLSPFEIPVKVNINVSMPEMPDINVSGDIEIPETRANEMVLEAI